jgi:hypothetical protein
MTKKQSRRTFLGNLLRAGAGLGALSAMGAGYTFYGEPGWLAVERVSVPIRNLPQALEGITIAQLSDLHASSVVRIEHITQAIEVANRQRPDLIVLTGDYVTDELAFIPIVANAIAGLSAPLGVYAVLGNHDYWIGAPERVVAALEDAGVTVLRNTHKQLVVRDSAIWLAGVDDVWEEQNDIDAALQGIPNDAFTVLLAHEPDFADVAAQRSVQLQLSGHTHGGQVRVPFLGAPALPPLGRRYPIGLQRVPNRTTQVYTNRGIGLISPSVRLNCRPEVTVLTLQRERVNG